MDPHSTLTYSHVTDATLTAVSPVSGRLQSHLMVAVVADKGFEEGFGPLTQITHPTQQKPYHQIPLHCLYTWPWPSLAWPGVLSTSQSPGHSSIPSVPPGGGLGYIIPAFADVNS